MSNQESFKVSTTLAAYRIVAPLSITADTVAYPEGITSANPIMGVTLDTVVNTTDNIAIKTHGIAKVEFNETMSSGLLVTADTSGKGTPFTAVTAPTGFVGVLLGPAVTATGTIAEVLVNPGFMSIP